MCVLRKILHKGVITVELPMIGTPEKTASSEFQVTLVDKTIPNEYPLGYPRINRFFDNLADRNAFVTMLESSINKFGGKIAVNEKLRHPVFTSFDIFDNKGFKNFELTVYH